MVSTTGFCLAIHHLSKNWNRNIYPSKPLEKYHPRFLNAYLLWKLSLEIKQISAASKTGTLCCRNNFPSDIYNMVLLYLIIQLLNLVLLSWNCSAAEWLWSQSPILVTATFGLIFLVLVNLSSLLVPFICVGYLPPDADRLQHKTNCIFGFLCSVSLPPLLSCSSKQIFLFLS